MKRSLLRIASSMLVGAASAAAGGHEFWIEPSTYHPGVGETFRLELRHGERFRGERVPRREDLIDRFTLAGAEGEAPVVGRSGGPTSFTRATSPGLHVAGFRSRRMRNDLDAASFERYLREEGLARIADLRAARGETDRPGREVYSRGAKTLIAVGDGGPNGPGHDRVLGFPLEIVLETSPAALRGGEDLVVRVLFAGKPLADVEVVAVSAADPEHLRRRRTDEEGRVRFPPAEPGAWLLTTIHMVPAPPDVDADWESFWASFTFERQAGSGSSVSRRED